MYNINNICIDVYVDVHAMRAYTLYIYIKYKNIRIMYIWPNDGMMWDITDITYNQHKYG